jgi:hypothetical protein
VAKEFIITKHSDGSFKAKPLKDYLDSLSEGKYKVTVTKSDKRTLLQNDWLHAVLPGIRDALRDTAGYNEIRTTEDAKDFLKTMFFKKEITNGIETVEIIQGTSETSKLDFASKAEDIIIWAQQYLGIDIAPSGKQFEFFE